MRKTININLGGQAFTIDDDAYHMLSQYLDTIANIYRAEPDCAEIMADIEARMAEILLQIIPSPQTIISIPLLNSVIERIGQPDDFRESTTIEENTTFERVQMPTPPPFPQNYNQRAKRLFRDPNNRLLGGVCSGVAAYLNIDTTWVRLATVALCFLSFSTVAIVYLIMWIVVPEANTPAKQMQMYGESPTFQNIGKTVSGMFYPHSGNVMDNSFGQRLSRFFAGMAKVILVAIVIVSIPILFALTMAFIGVMIALIASLCGGLVWLFDGFTYDYLPVDNVNVLFVTILGAILAIIIPLGIIIWQVLTGAKRPMTSALKRTLLCVWLVAVITAGVGSAYCKVNNVKEKLDRSIEKISKKESEETVINVADTISADTTAVSLKKPTGVISTEKKTGVKVVDNGTTIIDKNNKKITLSRDSVVVEKPDGSRKVTRKMNK